MITLEYGKTVHALMNIVPTEFYRLYPSQLLFKDVIESSCEGGYFSLNFGGDLRRKGLIEYKEKLGGTSCETKKLYANSPFGKVLRSIQRMIKL
jgi:CelD/BcsL family acetyltransferase involved in cellulose biosynthesis